MKDVPYFICCLIHVCGFKTSAYVPVVALSNVWIASRKLGLAGGERSIVKEIVPKKCLVLGCRALIVVEPTSLTNGSGNQAALHSIEEGAASILTCRAEAKPCAVGWEAAPALLSGVLGPSAAGPCTVIPETAPAQGDTVLLVVLLLSWSLSSCSSVFSFMALSSNCAQVRGHGCLLQIHGGTVELLRLDLCSCSCIRSWIWALGVFPRVGLGAGGGGKVSWVSSI